VAVVSNHTLRVLATLESRLEAIFPQRKQPWYQPNKEDVAE
jgi:hypothetical protein